MFWTLWNFTNLRGIGFPSKSLGDNLQKEWENNYMNFNNNVEFVENSSIVGDKSIDYLIVKGWKKSIIAYNFLLSLTCKHLEENNPQSNQS